MRRKDLKRLFRLNPDFENWLMKDSLRAVEVRSNPAIAKQLYKRYKSEKQRKALINFDSLQEKTKRASSMLNNVQMMMEMMAEQEKKDS